MERMESYYLSSSWRRSPMDIPILFTAQASSNGAELVHGSALEVGQAEGFLDGR